MASTVTTVTVAPTARPWDFAAIAASAGAASSSVGYNANKTDGTGTAGASAGLNSGFAYGQQHGAVGETGPRTVAVTPNSFVSIKYNSGTVKKDSGSSLVGPMGTGGTLDVTDANGYVYPSDCMPAALNLSLKVPACGVVGLCGCFTDALGNIIANSFWDWSGRGGTNTAASQITLKAPPGAAFISMGINDTVLFDNGGAGFNVDVVNVEAEDYAGDSGFLARFPIGVTCPTFMPDVANYQTLVRISASWMVMYLPLLLVGYGGQIFPRDSYQAGGGQAFPY
jgi:hypothetical protein